MGLFERFFNRSNGHLNDSMYAASHQQEQEPVVTEDIFVEKDKPAEVAPASAEIVGINVLFQFLERNHEAKGYDDALINPDSSHLQQNIEALNNELERTIRKVKTFYEDFIREIDFHIASRSRSGMIDIVEELTMKKKTAESHIKQVIEIENQAKNSEGVGRGIIISYTRGFNNGLAAISHHSIMRKSF